mgnify:CR=1 FL=1
MMRRAMTRFVQKLKKLDRIQAYLANLAMLLLLAGAMLASAACGPGGIGGCIYELLTLGRCCNLPSPTGMGADGSVPDAVHISAQGHEAQVWLEFGMTGVYTPTTTARGLSLATAHGETPPILDELAEKAYVAVRVPHAPPNHTESSLSAGIPPGAPHAMTFNYYSPPSASTPTRVPITLTRRAEYEALVNSRFPIADGKSHWEVWWLPEGESFPVPDQPFRLQADSIPRPFELYFRADFKDGDPLDCAGDKVQVLLYNSYVFIGPYDFLVHFTGHVPPLEPLLTLGTTCGYYGEGLFPTFLQSITATVPITHVQCLENWDLVTRTFTIDAASSQGWDYDYYYQAAEPGASPVPVAGVPFTVTVGPFTPSWPPGMLGILAVHTPDATLDDTVRETFELTATSVISPDVQDSAFSTALGTGYRLDEEAAQEDVWSLYLPVLVRKGP